MNEIVLTRKHSEHGNYNPLKNSEGMAKLVNRLIAKHGIRDYGGKHLLTTRHCYQSGDSPSPSP